MTASTDARRIGESAATASATLGPATTGDAHDIAELMDLAGEGIPRAIWRSYAPEGCDPLAFGAERAAEGAGNYSWRNAHLIRDDSGTAGMVLAYRLPDDPPDFSDLHSLEYLLIKLEAQVPRSFYINALAVYPRARGRGYGRQLMEYAHHLARASGCDHSSLVVFANNRRAKALYESLGYVEQAAEPPIDDPVFCDHGKCLLMVRRRLEPVSIGVPSTL